MPSWYTLITGTFDHEIAGHVRRAHGDYTPVAWLSTAGIVPQQWAERVGERHGACAEGGGCRPTH